VGEASEEPVESPGFAEQVGPYLVCCLGDHLAANYSLSVVPKLDELVEPPLPLLTVSDKP